MLRDTILTHQSLSYTAERCVPISDKHSDTFVSRPLCSQSFGQAALDNLSKFGRFLQPLSYLCTNLPNLESVVEFSPTLLLFKRIFVKTLSSERSNTAQNL